MINLGNINIKDLYVGSKPIQKAYVGTQLVYQKEDPIYSDYYGISFARTLEDSAVKRTGNKEYHRTLPLQSQMRGCTIDVYGVVKYLKPDDWTKYEDGTDRDYTLNTMVEIPEFWVLTVLDGEMLVEYNNVEIRLYQHEIPDTPNAEHFSKSYVSAYEACLVDDTLKSITDGNIRPAVSMTASNMQSCARNNGNFWNMYTYKMHKAITMLYIVEYANMDGLLDVNNTLTADGYKQGGIGIGVTDGLVAFNGSMTYNMVNCGVTDAIGNGSGEVTVSVNSTNASGGIIRTVTKKPNRYRGIENPYGHITKKVIDIIFKYNMPSDSNEVYTTEDPNKFGSGINNYQYLCNTVAKNVRLVELAIFRKLELFAALNQPDGISMFRCTQLTNDSTTNRLLEIGGTAEDGSICGWFCLYSYGEASAAYTSDGTRLTYTI